MADCSTHVRWPASVERETRRNSTVWLIYALLAAGYIYSMQIMTVDDLGHFSPRRKLSVEK